MAHKKSKPKGGLLLIAVLLVGSGVIRLGAQTGQAIARDVPKTQISDDANQTSLAPIDFEAAVNALKQREANVAAQEEKVEARLKVLDDAEQRFEKSRAALVEAEKRLADTISQAEAASENDIGQLAKVYEKMKPKDAAAVFAQMDPEFAAGFLALVKSDTAAQILAGLTPPKAYAISVLLAGRNANVPTE